MSTFMLDNGVRPHGFLRTAGLVVAVVAMLLPARAVAQGAPRPSPAVGVQIAPPAVIQGLDARPVTPLEFSRAWLGKAEAVRRRRTELMAAGQLDGVSPAVLAQQGAALTGTLRVPVIPVVYKDVRVPFPESALTERLFGPAKGDTVSYSSYFEEVSGGLLRVEGVVTPWIRTRKSASHYLTKKSYGWASFGRMTELRQEVLRLAGEHIDWGQFDNDGPDGIPNSGDDDGFVDFVAIVYATKCNAEWREGSIWPHRGAMAPVETSSSSANGGKIRIADYVILPAAEPGSCKPLEVGVLAHETGHALGLPDLYDYDGGSQGIGAWGLMATGSHSARHSPSHLDAWTKEQLGWVTVRWLKEGTEHLTLDAVGESRTVYRYDLPDSRGEYVLLENRQKLGSDRFLPGNGLLAWHVDPDRGEIGSWHADAHNRAINLIQADSRNDLAEGRAADAGDPFPGRTGRTTLTVASSKPLHLSDIAERNGNISMTATVGFTGPALVASVPAVRLTAVSGGVDLSQTVTVQREGGAVGVWTPRKRMPWLTLQQSGDALVLVGHPTYLPPGLYTDTVDLVLAGAGEAEGEGQGPIVAGRLAVQLSVVPPGVPEVVSRGLPWSWGLAASGGRIFQASYGWDPLAMRPKPRLLQMGEDRLLAETLVRLPAEALYSPVAGLGGVVYVLGHAEGANYLYRVHPNGTAEVVASGLGDTPAYGAAPLPDGSLLVAEWSGRIQRVTPTGEIQPWTELGVNIYQIAVDAAGTIYAAAHAGHVLRVDQGGMVVIPTGFAPGRLVAVAASASGEIYAAERGGEGRILQISPDGTRRELGRVSSAQFYGLALDDRFLYAIDLQGRNLLRIPLVDATAPRPRPSPEAGS